MDGMDHIAGAPRDAGPVLMIVRRPDRGARQEMTAARIDPRVGLIGDNWAVKGSQKTKDGSSDPDKQVTIMSSRVIDLLTDGDRSCWGLAGDQLYVDLNLDPSNLPAGSRLAVGPAILQISDKPHLGCAKFADHFGVDALRFVNIGPGRHGNFRGLNARVVTGGTVTVGDPVSKFRGPV